MIFPSVAPSIAPMTSAPQVRSKTQDVALLLSTLLVGGCVRHFNQVSDVSKLKADERILVGEVLVVGGDISKWVPGEITGVYPIFDYYLPRKLGDETGFPVSSSEDSAVPMSGLASRGDVFNIGVNHQDTYWLSVHVTYAWPPIGEKWVNLPVFLRFNRSNSPCEYVGTIVLRRRPSPNGLEVTVEDHYDEKKDKLAHMVKGCVLTKNVAESVTVADMMRAPTKPAQPAPTPRR